MSTKNDLGSPDTTVTANDVPHELSVRGAVARPDDARAANARRYEWIRDSLIQDGCGAELDAAIDQEMKEKP